MTDTKLLARTVRKVSSGGQMRIVSEHWRDVFQGTEQVEYDLVERPDGSYEIRLRAGERSRN